MWRNGRRNGLKIRWALTRPVPVRVRPSAAMIDFSSETLLLVRSVWRGEELGTPEVKAGALQEEKPKDKFSS